MKDLTICDKCKKQLDGGWVEMVDPKTRQILETVCVSCDRAQRVEEFRNTGYLSTRLVEQAHINEILKRLQNGDQEILDVFSKIPPEIKLFEQEVWFGGLQTIAQNASTKGTKAEVDDFTLMCFTMCGRAMITIENEESSITLITDEDSSRSCMGWRGMYSTADQAIALLQKARSEWKNGLRPIEDKKVTLAIPGMG